MMTIIVVEVAITGAAAAMPLTVIHLNKHIRLRLVPIPLSVVATEKKLERKPTRKHTALTDYSVTMWLHTTHL
jgi:hypothetical protein